MLRKPLAFTLIELLIVIAVVAILSAILFPVFARVKSAARKTVCVSNFHQAQLAVGLYIGDYDDYFMPVNHRPGGPLNSRVDRTWVQMLLPYARSFSVFRCPEDYRGDQMADSTFDQDLVPGDPFSQYYTASQYVNTGYNYLYLSPVVFQDRRWVAQPKSATTFSDPSHTILFVDSIGARDAQGNPTGGGSWLVVPPCRYLCNDGTAACDSFGFGRNVQPRLFNGVQGWAVFNDNSPFRFGGAWAWHTNRATVVRLDGSVKPSTTDGLANGCDVEANWGGTIGDPGDYPWYMR